MDQINIKTTLDTSGVDSSLKLLKEKFDKLRTNLSLKVKPEIDTKKIDDSLKSLKDLNINPEITPQVDTKNIDSVLKSLEQDFNIVKNKLAQSLFSETDRQQVIFRISQIRAIIQDLYTMTEFEADLDITEFNSALDQLEKNLGNIKGKVADSILSSKDSQSIINRVNNIKDVIDNLENIADFDIDVNTEKAQNDITLLLDEINKQIGFTLDADLDVESKEKVIAELEEMAERAYDVSEALEIKAKLNTESIDDELSKIEKEILDTKEEIETPVELKVDTKILKGSLKDLKTEFKELQNQLGSNLLSPEENQKLLERIGEIKTEIKDLTEEINRVGDAGNVFGDLVTLSTPLVAGFTAAASSISLLGIENEKINEILVKTTQLTVGLNAIQQIADTTKLKNLFIYRSEQLKQFILDKLTFKQTVQQSVANTAEASTKGLVVGITKLATKAQIAWNAAVLSNPIMLLVAGVAALGAGIFFLVKYLDQSTKGFEAQNKAIDGTTFASKEARDSYNELQFSLRDLNLEYQEIVGNLSPFEKELAKLNLEIEKQIELIKNEYIDALQELEEKQSNIWRRIGNSIIEQLDRTGALTVLRIRKQTEERIKLEEESLKKIDEINQIAESKRLNDITKNNIEIVKEIESLESQLTDIRRRGLDERQLMERRKLLADIGTLRTSLQNTIKLYGDTSTKISEITDDIKTKLNEIKFESDLIIINNETIKQIKILEKEQENFNKQVEIQKDQLKSIVEDKDKSIKQSEEELDLLYEKQFLLDNENKRLKDILNITIQRRNVVKLEGDEIRKSISDNTKLFEERLKTLNKETLIKEGLIKNDKIVLDTSEKQIKAQQLLLKEGKLRSDEINLQSSLYEQLQGFLSEQVKLEQQIFSFENQLTDARKEYNDVVVETNDLTNKIGLYQSTNTEELEKQIESLEEIKIKNDEIVKTLIDRLATERKLDDQLQISSINTQRTLNQDLVKLRKIYLKGEINDEKEKDRKIFEEREKALNSFYEYKIKNAGTDDEAEIYRLQWEDELDTLAQSFTDKWQRINEDTVNIITDMALIGANAFTEILTRSIDLKFEQLSTRLQNETDTQLKSLENLKNEGLISEQEYSDKLLKIEEDSLKKSNELKIRQAKAEKQAAIIQITIDTAAAVAKALAQGGGLFGPGLAGLVLFQGLAQSALVASQPLPEYEMGGLVQGPSHANGGIPIEMEGNEYIIRKDIVEKPGMKSLLDMINSGQLNNTRIQTNDNSNLIKELKETILSITNIPVVNVETEYTKVQRKVNSIETRARF